MYAYALLPILLVVLLCQSGLFGDFNQLSDFLKLIPQ